MRVALMSSNAPMHNAVGNQIAEKVRFFHERGAEVQLFVHDARRLHPALTSCCIEVTEPRADGPAWDFLRHADLIVAVYAEYYDLLQLLPCLADTGPRIVFEYLGVTPSKLWSDQHREGLEQSARQRGYAWCADHVLAASQASRQELLEATHFPREHATVLPLVVDAERFHSDGRERFLHSRLGIERRILLYVGRLAGNKRVPLMIEALARLSDPSLHAAIIGDVHDVYAEEMARCQALAEQLGVAQRVHFLGQLDDADLSRAYRSADVLVMPSLHEGFCVPVLEAMACGLPVVASRSAALPETVGDAGLTFAPNDVDDLAAQLQRVLGDPPKDRQVVGPCRVAIVSFRFGPEIVGGAETSLRTMAKALQTAGHHVEVFTTCTTSESHWRNDLPAGTTTIEGLTVHRFPIDAHDAAAHGEVVRAIVEAEGNVTPETERRYLEHSIHSTALIACLHRRESDFDAIVTGPYLFGLTDDIAERFPGKTLIVPCFHDEPLARLAHWPRRYRDVGGIFYHSVEEQKLAQQLLGVNHPNSAQLGTIIEMAVPTPAPSADRPYVVYCGRYSEQKNLPLLLEWAARYQAERPGQLDFWFMGRGEVKISSEPWLKDLGRVDETTKRAVLAGAKALVQLSTQESLSLVVLEAWARATPVIVHHECAVLAGQVQRSQGGVTVTDYATFAAALNDLFESEAMWLERGKRGRAHVESHYASTQDYVERLTTAIDRMRWPIAQQMRERGLQRAQDCSRERWQLRFAEFVENLLLQPPRTGRNGLRLEPMRDACHAVGGTLLLPVRLVNTGTHPAVPAGPGRTLICCEIHGDRIGVDRTEIALPALLMPGQTQVAALPISAPTLSGSYRILLWVERFGTKPTSREDRVEIPLTVEAERKSRSASCAATFLDTVQESLPKAQHLQQLPAGYVDVTEGRLAPVKRLIKRKLLHNFKHAYVDVMSRQQSQVNGHVVLMIQQLAECCAMLDHAVAGLHQRLDGLEARMEQTILAVQTRADVAEESQSELQS